MNDASDNAFDNDTAVTALDGGRYRGELSDRWHIGRVPNGGYTMAVAGRALGEALPFAEPLVVTGYYLEPSEAGPFEIAVDVLRTGRASATAEARFVQGGRERARYLATFAELEPRGRLTRLTAEPPPLPDPEACMPFRYVEGLTPAIIRNFDIRMPVETAGWAMGRVSDVAELGGWIRFVDGREPDALSLLLFADAFPPAVFAMLGMQSWVPTLELTVQIRNRPAPGWLLCWFRTRYVTDGYLEEDGEVWDSEGRLVALSRQLARLR